LNASGNSWSSDLATNLVTISAHDRLRPTPGARIAARRGRLGAPPGPRSRGIRARRRRGAGSALDRARTTPVGRARGWTERVAGKQRERGRSADFHQSRAARAGLVQDGGADLERVELQRRLRRVARRSRSACAECGDEGRSSVDPEDRSSAWMGTPAAEKSQFPEFFFGTSRHCPHTD